MSLSKYYKNTASFKPEELVKRAEGGKESSGWQSLPIKETLPFQTQQPPAVVTPREQPAKAQVQEPAASQTDEPKPKATAILLPEAKPIIDLSNYLERTVAEQKIAEAYQQGFQAAQQKWEEDFGATTTTLLNTCQQLDTLRETIITNSSAELVNFALALAEKIVRLSVREQDTTIIATIEEALQRAVKSDEFTLYIHPEDYQVVAENAEQIIAGLIGLNKIVIKKDNRVERGGAKIESDNCTIDATISSQFAVIREEIKKGLG